MTREAIPAARLHGPRDLRIDSVPHPGDPAPGEALVRVEAVGICGSDLHAFRHGSTGGDVAIEATTGGGAVQQGAEMLAPGGRLIVVGIDEQDRLTLRHSTARRKGLTIRMVRRMKHAYPRAIQLAAQGGLDLTGFITHWFPLEQSPEAIALNAGYRDGVIKLMIHT